MSLYKYITSERIDILENFLIRFTQPGAFNDPFEMQPHFHSLDTDDALRLNLSNTFNEAIYESYLKSVPPPFRNIIPFNAVLTLAEFKKTELVKLYPQICKLYMPLVNRQFQPAFDRIIGILCLTEKPDNLLMWAHYAESHTGLVIEFDEKHPFFNQKKGENDFLRYLKKVIYSDIRPNLSIKDMQSFEIFLTKSKEWEYEQEWRIILTLSDADKKITVTPYDIHLFKIPPEAIKGIIMGCRMNPDKKGEITRFLCTDSRLSHVKLSQAIIDEKRFLLKIT